MNTTKHINDQDHKHIKKLMINIKTYNNHDDNTITYNGCDHYI